MTKKPAAQAPTPAAVAAEPPKARTVPKHAPADYYTLPLDLFSVADLTDALGIERAAAILGTSSRAIYTVRNTNEMGLERVAKLQAAIQKDEAAARRRLVQMRNLQAIRRAQRGTSDTTTEETTCN